MTTIDLFSLHRIQERGRTYGFSVFSDARLVQEVIKDSLATVPSEGGDEASVTYLNDSFAAEKVDLERSIESREEKLADAKRHIQEFDFKDDAPDDLATKVYKAGAVLKSSAALFFFLKDRVSRQRNQLVEKTHL